MSQTPANRRLDYMYAPADRVCARRLPVTRGVRRPHDARSSGRPERPEYVDSRRTRGRLAAALRWHDDLRLARISAIGDAERLAGN